MKNTILLIYKEYADIIIDLLIVFWPYIVFIIIAIVSKNISINKEHTLEQRLKRQCNELGGYLTYNITTKTTICVTSMEDFELYQEEK